MIENQCTCLSCIKINYQSMKAKFILENFNHKNSNELSPWQSEFTTNPNLNKQELIPQQQLVSIKPFLPKIFTHEDKPTNKFTKIQYLIPKKEFILDDKTLDTIKSPKQSSFNAFITKYKADQKKKIKGYLLLNEDESINSNYRLPNQIKLINFNSLNNEDQHQHSFSVQNYRPKEVQFCKKRSLSNLIKSIGKGNLLKLKEPCRYSSWLLTKSIETERKYRKQYASQQKMERKTKLLEPNLMVRRKNLFNQKKDIK